MKAALLPDRGVVKVAGDDARNFLHGLISADVLKLTPGAARFGALLSPQIHCAGGQKRCTVRGLDLEIGISGVIRRKNFFAFRSPA